MTYFLRPKMPAGGAALKRARAGTESSAGHSPGGGLRGSGVVGAGEGMDLAQGQGDAVLGASSGEHAHFGLAGSRGFHGCAIRVRGDVVGQDQIKDG